VAGESRLAVSGGAYLRGSCSGVASKCRRLRGDVDGAALLGRRLRGDSEGLGRYGHVDGSRLRGGF